MLKFVATVSASQYSYGNLQMKRFHGFFEWNVLTFEICFSSHYGHYSVHKFSYLFLLCNTHDIQDN